VHAAERIAAELGGALEIRGTERIGAERFGAGRSQRVGRTVRVCEPELSRVAGCA
jgi:hypothetical protein